MKRKEFDEIEESATPGPWLEREDDDYYQGGTYLGIKPYKYRRGEEMISAAACIPCPPEESDGFGVNVCRLHDNEDANKRFLQASRDTAKSFSELWAVAERILERYGAYSDFDDLREVLKKLEEL